MITKRRKLIAIILLAVIGGVIAYPLLRQDDEPTYKGHSLTEWLTGNLPAADVAVADIGTNALPYLLKWIDYETPRWRTTLRVKLPAFVLYRTSVQRWLEGEAQRRAESAPLAFRYLGTNAVGAIPELERLMKDTSRRDSSKRAIVALACIGEPALPVLKVAFADKSHSDRWLIISAVTLMPASDWTNAWSPIVVGALNDQDRGVRVEATNLLKNYYAATNVPKGLFRGFAPDVFSNTPPK